MIRGIGILLQMSPFIKFSELVLCGGGTQERQTCRPCFGSFIRLHPIIRRREEEQEDE